MVSGMLFILGLTQRARKRNREVRGLPQPKRRKADPFSKKRSTFFYYRLLLPKFFRWDVILGDRLSIFIYHPRHLSIFLELGMGNM